MSKALFIEKINNIIEENEELASGNDSEIIYKIDNLNIYGGFDFNGRGINHDILVDANYSWEKIISWGTIVIPELASYISDVPIVEFENLGYSRLDPYNNHLVGYSNISPLSESDFKKLIEFNIFDNVVLKEELDGIIICDDESQIRANSYEEIFKNYGYHAALKEDFKLLGINELESSSLFTENPNLMNKLIMYDDGYYRAFLEATRERDLDNDGVPDRIDIDDTRSNVQIISDMSDENKKSTGIRRQNINQQ